MTTSSFSVFKALHFQDVPLLLPNSWDAASTVLLQQDGARAVATSSAALAWSLGYADGGSLPRDELLAAVRRIMRVARVPLSIDLEDGYSSDPHEVAQLVAEVARWGVAGINLEDGRGPADLLVAKIAASKRALADADISLFINTRTDVYLNGLAHGDAAIRMCADRLQRYRAAGADGAFVPGMSAVADVTQLAPQIDMPLSLMAVPGLPSASELFAAGARRISVGAALFQTTYGYCRAQARRFMADGDVTGLFAHPLPSLNSAMQAP